MSDGQERKIPHWSSDFVEHIRTVNFTLLAVCIGLIALVQSHKTSDVSAAQAQLAHIEALTNGWGSDVDSALNAESERIRRSYPLRTRRVSAQKTYCSVTISSYPVVEVDSSDPHKLLRIDKARRDLLGAPPKTLLEFRRFWNSLGAAIVLVPDVDKLGDKYICKPPNEPPQTYPITVADTTPSEVGDGAMEASTGEQETTITQTLNIKSAPFIFRGAFSVEPYEVYRSYLPVVSVTRVPFLGQNAILDRHRDWDLTGGQFDKTFSALNELTFEHPDWTLDIVAANLNAKGEISKSDSFEIAGVKVSVESAIQFGVVLILAIQLYFWIHLHELSPKLRENDPGWDVAWIGVYQSLPARVFFLLSTSGIPVLAIGLIGRIDFNHKGYLSKTLYGFALLVSVGLSLLLFKALPRRRARPTKQP
jgi:hypothetical protein